MRAPTPEERSAQEASVHWPRVNKRGTKVKCPECGQQGYPCGKWTWAHHTHTKAPCGRMYVTGRYLQHRVHCNACRGMAKPVEEVKP